MAQGIPRIDSRSREDLLAELRQNAARLGLAGRPGGLSDALFTLYSHMLSETVQRLNRTPEKHRMAFLNCRHTESKPACPGQTVVVFEVVKGYDAPVVVPEDTMLTAKGESGPVAYRVKRDVQVAPSRIMDMVVASRANDAIRWVYSREDAQRMEPFALDAVAQPGRHVAGFVYPGVFCSADGRLEAELLIELSLDGEPISPDVLADERRFGWSLAAWEEEASEPVTARVEGSGKDGLWLRAEGFAGHRLACLRLELRDGSLTGLSIDRLEVQARREHMLPDVVLSGERALDPARFYPFGEPLRPYEECAVFCDEAFFHEGAELTLDFSLELETTEEALPQTPKEIEYKWIMRKPKPEPPPVTAEAQARAVTWEYWDGEAYRTLRCKEGGRPFAAFERAGAARMIFDRPNDMAPCEYAGRTGYFLRLSCGGCDELYRLPRRVHNPRMVGLRLSSRYAAPVGPVGRWAENFGDSRALEAGETIPFCPPPCEGEALFLGLDRVPPDVRLQCYVQIGGSELGGELRVDLMAGREARPLTIEDNTSGLCRSGLLSLLIPERPDACRLFGRRRFWLRLTPGSPDDLPWIHGVFLNAQWAENRQRRRERFTLSELPRDGRLRLSHDNVVQAWVYVRTQDSGKWQRWQEQADTGEALGPGLFQFDYRNGMLYLPGQITSLTPVAAGQAMVGVVYDTTDGAGGNLPAGAVKRMYEEIPFIASVTNPLPVANGFDSEDDPRLADRVTHLLYSGGRAVSARDYELLALDLCPLVHRARCLPGRPVQLALLLKKPEQTLAFEQICRTLRQNLRQMGAVAMGDDFFIRQAERVSLRCDLTVEADSQLLTQRVRALRDKLTAYLDPVSGGSDGEGWPVGRLPSREQIRLLALTRMSGMRLLSLRVTAKSEGRWIALEDLKAGPFCVPGEVRVKMEVKRYADAAHA